MLPYLPPSLCCALALSMLATPSWAASEAAVQPSASTTGPQRTDELVANGGFEDGENGWQGYWSRKPGSGSATVDASIAHAGRNSMRIEHRDEQDWSYQQDRELKVETGEIYELAGWVRIAGEGSATLCARLADAKGKAIDYTFGESSVAGPSKGWQEVRSRFLVPEEGRSILARFIGVKPATVWFDDVSLRRVGSIDDMTNAKVPKQVDLENASVKVTLETADGTIQITDRRTGRAWQQRSEARFPVLAAALQGKQIAIKLLDPISLSPFDVTLSLDGDRPELLVAIQGSGPMKRPLAFPAPFTAEKGMLLILPVNEGISYPVDDESLPDRMRYHLYGGHGLCMAWYGMTDGAAGVMALVETPDDAAVRIPRRDELLCLQPEWESQKGDWGYTRKLRYILFDQGGYVAMCKRYREYARQSGLLRTLAEKRERNPDVDLLIGAVNVWCWERDPVDIVRQLQAAGVERILWSNRSTPEQIAAMNEMGVLSSRYDIYQDVMNPAEFPRLGHRHADWPTEAWPQDLMVGANGELLKGWQVRAKDGTMIPCGVLCDRLAPDYALRRIGEELKTHAYRSRFIDTTTASPWRECYNPDHPLTRSESKQWKMRLLEVVSKDFNLVTGCETGHDASVPYLHYYEGMLSLGPYRVPDAGRRMQEIVEEVPERVEKFQTGHRYRLPLWELVYHDCVVAQWYWGDYNNKLPKLWDRRDLWNALYGTPPMFMFNRKLWEENRERFAQSYRRATPVARATGYREMLSHEWLTEDHSVQRTRFDGGVTVTVNFGDKGYRMADGSVLKAMDCRVEGVKQ
ncbi:MAG: glycoside hydrolase [Planctomycetota bacterium]